MSLHKLSSQLFQRCPTFILSMIANSEGYLPIQLYNCKGFDALHAMDSYGARLNVQLDPG